MSIMPEVCGVRKYSGLVSPANKKAPLKGLFADNIWRCNCDPRLPAQRFQTKNGGRNHGRWCQSLPNDPKIPSENG